MKKYTNSATVYKVATSEGFVAGSVYYSNKDVDIANIGGQKFINIMYRNEDGLGTFDQGVTEYAPGGKCLLGYADANICSNVPAIVANAVVNYKIDRTPYGGDTYEGLELF